MNINLTLKRRKRSSESFLHNAHKLDACGQERKRDTVLRAIKTTCILWAWGNHTVFASGYALGIGHQKSAALADAIRNADINLSENVAYRDGAPVREALLAIARANRPDAKIIGVFEAYN